MTVFGQQVVNNLQTEAFIATAAGFSLLCLQNSGISEAFFDAQKVRILRKNPKMSLAVQFCGFEQKKINDFCRKCMKTAPESDPESIKFADEKVKV